MRYDRDIWKRGPRSRADLAGRGEYGEAYEGPFPRHDWSEGFLGGGLRSRGSWGYPRAEDEFFTNYDLEHGYAIGGRSLGARPPRGAPPREGRSEFSSPAARGGYAWGEEELATEEYGPARYGYGPYYDRLRRRRRSDDDLRQEVEDTLFYDTWVDADAITISVQDGVVTLRGTLTSYDELRYAVDDAWDVDGVRGVRSEMQVDEDTGTGLGTGRYEPGAPHMHGHPDAGGAGASPGRSRSTGTSRSPSTSTPDRGRGAEAGSSGRRGGRSVNAGATSAPPTGEGMAAAGTGSARASRRPSGRRGRAGATGAESRRGRGSAGGGTSAGATSAGGTALGESAPGAGESGTDVSRS